jgi:hypothetical protein
VTSEDKLRLGKHLELLAKYYRQNVDLGIIKWMINDLESYSYEEVHKALEEYRKNTDSKYFPTSGQLIHFLKPEASESDIAVTTMDKIIYSIGKFGWSNPKEAKEYIGELGWYVVEKNNGWLFICENLGLGLDIGVFKAQVRDSVKATKNMSEIGLLDKPLALNGKSELKVLDYVKIKELPKG